jgi:GMP synthase (glutamine-hydrolysing)
MLKLLIIEGNEAGVRERIKARLGATTAQRYRAVIQALAPSASIDIADPADVSETPLSEARLSAYHGVMMTGSALNIYEPNQSVARQLELVKRVFALGLPFFGSCWGLQVAVVAAGGSVERHPGGREFGFARRIQVTPAGQQHAMLAGKPLVFEAPTVHIDHVTRLPAGAVVLAQNEHSVQALCFSAQQSQVWGVQYHPEYTFMDIVAVAERYQERLLADGTFESLAAFNHWVQEIATLEQNLTPALVFRHGLGPAMTQASLRQWELSQWLKSLV